MIDRPEQWSASRIIGLDLSKKDFKGCILFKEDGYKKAHHITGEMTPEGRIKFISSLTSDDWVGIEGGTSSSTFARHVLTCSEAKIFMFNPGKLEIIFKTSCKTDRKDAVKIAHYMRDCHPDEWVLIPIPTEEESAMRSLVTNQIYLKQEIVRHINKLHAVFTQAGYPHLKKSDLKELDKRVSLIEYYFPDEHPCKAIARVINDLICSTELAEEAIEERIKTDILIAHPELALPWLSIPGVGPLTAAACIAYMGDGERFEGPEQVRNYVGLLPYKNQSGKQDIQGGVTAFGCKPIRRNIIQAAWRTKTLAMRCPITLMWDELGTRGKLGQKAAVAIANKMLSIGWTLIKKRELYNGCKDYKVLKRKLIANKLTAIDTSMFPELA